VTGRHRCRPRRRRPMSAGAACGRVGYGHRQCARGRARRERRQVRIHQTSRTAPGEDGEGDPDEGDLGRVHREHRVGDEDLAVGRVQRHLNGEAVARRPGLRGDPDRGGGVDERQALRVAVREGELVAGERHDDGHGIGRRGKDGDGDGGPLRREGNRALGPSVTWPVVSSKDLAVGAQPHWSAGRAEHACLGAQEGVAERGQVGGMPVDGQAERRQLLAIERNPVGPRCA